VEGECRIGEK
jgi:hypothetical protein